MAASPSSLQLAPHRRGAQARAVCAEEPGWEKSPPPFRSGLSAEELSHHPLVEGVHGSLPGLVFLKVPGWTEAGHFPILHSSETEGQTSRCCVPARAWRASQLLALRPRGNKSSSLLCPPASHIPIPLFLGSL